jgi:hypothetical protein
VNTQRDDPVWPACQQDDWGEFGGVETVVGELVHPHITARNTVFGQFNTGQLPHKSDQSVSCICMIISWGNFLDNNYISGHMFLSIS